jgi:hypothetical protein
VTAIDLQVSKYLRDNDERVKAEPDKAFALARIEVENEAEEPREPPESDDIALLSGQDQYRRMIDDPDDREEAALEEPASGELYQKDEEIHPGIVLSGWVIFYIPISVSDVTLAVTEYGFTEVIDTVYWEGRLDTSSLPNVKLKAVNAPGSVEIGEDIEVQVVAENSGGSEGTFNRTFAYDLPDLYSQGQRRVNFDLPADSEQTSNLTFSPEEMGNLSLSTGDESYEVQITAATVDMGDEHQLPSGASVQFSKMETVLRYSYDSYGGEKSEIAPDGSQYVFASFDVENPTDEKVSAPFDSSLYLSHDGTTYSPESTDRFASKMFTDPVIGEEYSGGGNIAPGNRKNGWVQFVIDSEIPEDEIVLQMQDKSGEEVNTQVNWE